MTFLTFLKKFDSNENNNNIPQQLGRFNESHLYFLITGNQYTNTPHTHSLSLVALGSLMHLAEPGCLCTMQAL